ncbi:MAG TPA: PAS domain S-box protein [Burkholderiaceae bacterium]|nr:PAS domain S-box protein [Burkholderiaceae bacterium]
MNVDSTSVVAAATSAGSSDDAARNERWYRAALHVVPGVVYEWNARTGHTERSEGLFDLIGVKPQDVPPTAQWWRDRVHPDDLPDVDQRLSRMLRDGRPTFHAQYRVQHADGRWIHVWDRATVIYDDAGQVAGLVGNTVDITDRCIAEDRLRLAVEATGLGLWDADLRTCEIQCSELATRILGFDESEESKPTLDAWYATIHPDDLPAVFRTLETARSNIDERAHSVEYRRTHDHPDSTGFRQRWVCATIRAVYEGIGEARRAVRFVGTVLDITERKRADWVIRESEERFRLLVESIDDVFWIMDYQQRKQLYVSPAYTRLWGCDPNELYVNQSRWKERIHAEDREPTQRAFEAIEQNGQYEAEYRVTLDNGDVRWVRDRGIPVRDSQGRITRVIGVAEDVTDRKNAEHALREREQRLQLALDAARLEVWTVDLTTRAVSCGLGLYALFGITPEERSQLDVWGRRIHPDDFERVRRAFSDAIAGTRELNVECRVVLPPQADQPARERWVDAQAIIIRDDRGRGLKLCGVCADITDRKHQESCLRESEQQLRLITDAAPVGIARCSRDLTYRFVNHAYAQELLGVSAAEATGRSLRELMGERSFAAVRGYIERVLRGERLSYEGNIPLRDGNLRYLHVDYVPETNSHGEVVGWVAVVVDITERKHAEGRLYQREREFETLVENSPDIIARLAPDLRLLYINRAVENTMGGSPSDFIGHTFAELGLPAQMVNAVSEAANAAVIDRREQPCSFDFTRDGVMCHYVARAVPELDQHGNAESVLLIVYDVTDRVEAQHERDQILMREQAARAEAEAAAHARDQFLAIVSHELRSPLNGIQSWTHVLESQLTQPTPSMQRALAGIRTGVQQQVRLIEDLLDATRIMSGNLSIVKQPVTLLPILETAIASVRGTAQAKRIEVVTQVDLGPQQVEGDPDRLQQIVWNLLSNAVKFTPSGGRIELSAYQDGHDAVIVVKDNGKGIPPDFLPHMFDWFRRSEVASSRRQDGLGLGLALVRHLCDLHHGSVRAQSEGDDCGAIFTVRLPLRETPDISPDRRDRDQRPAAPRNALDGLRILLVDDQPETREALSIALAAYGADVTTLPSGKDAVAWLEQHTPPDILVCDIAMPDQDGHVTLQRIRASESRRGIPAEHRLPAIALSAFTQREDRMRALATGFQMHVAKPVAPEELVIVIATLTGRSSMVYAPSSFNA